MLKLVPKHWFSWDFTLSDATGMASAEIILSSWRERGAVVAGGKQYKVSSQGLVGPFVVEENGTELASAVKLSTFSQEFTVSPGGQQYTSSPSPGGVGSSVCSSAKGEWARSRQRRGLRGVLMWSCPRRCRCGSGHSLYG